MASEQRRAKFPSRTTCINLFVKSSAMYSNTVIIELLHTRLVQAQQTVLYHIPVFIPLTSKNNQKSKFGFTVETPFK